MKKEKKGCDEINPDAEYGICFLPQIDVEEHRRKVKIYLKGFNKAIQKALKDDNLTLKIKIVDQMVIPESMLEDTRNEHQISFVDKEIIKMR